MAWNKNYENRDIYALMSELNEMEVHERVAFLQQFLRAEPLSPLYDGVFPPLSAFVPTGGILDQGDCRCRVLGINSPTPITSYRGNIVGNNILPLFGENTYRMHQTKDKGFFRVSFSNVGPARFRRLSGETNACFNTSRNYVDTVSIGMVRMSFAQSCYDSTWHPIHCQCEQELSISWQYDSRVAVEIFLGGRWCFNQHGKKAMAFLDDMCVVLVGRPLETGRNTIRLLGFDRATVTSECNRDFDEKRLADLLKLGLGILGLVKRLPVDDPVVQFIWNQFYKYTIKSALENLLTKPWVIERGDCGRKVSYVNTEGVRYETLRGNDHVDVIMRTVTSMEVSGLTDWKATAHLVSAFRLSVILLEKSPTEEAPYCCTRSYGQYIVYSMFPPNDDRPTTSVYRQDVTSYFRSHPRAKFLGVIPYDSTLSTFVVPGTIGELYGWQMPDCPTVLNGRGYTSFSQTNGTTPFTIVSRGRDLWLLRSTVEAEAEDFGYRIFDLQGRLLKEGVGIGNEVLLHQFASTISSGVYLVGIQDKRAFHTYKVFVP